MITNEKRAFKRVPLKFTIRYRLYSKNNLTWKTTITENISLGGVYFISLEKFNIGQLIDCTINVKESLDGERWVTRVVRCENLKEKMINTFGIAVEFTKSIGGSGKNLKSYLKKYI